MRFGRRECEELQALLGSGEPVVTPVLRKRVSRHIDDCDSCTRRRKALLDPGGLASAMPMQPVPAALRSSVAELLAGPGVAPSVELVSWRPDGFPVGDSFGDWRRCRGGCRGWMGGIGRGWHPSGTISDRHFTDGCGRR
jgi:hypothetical protein